MPAANYKQKERGNGRGRPIKQAHTVATNQIMDLAGGFDDAHRSGTSIFDPVLCEIIYRWFCPVGGSIIDPFAGGSVRGIVASYLGFRYTGIELRAEQVKANEEQAEAIFSETTICIEKSDNMPELTPVEKHGEYWIKRDDVFSFAGVCGGKVRSCLAIARNAKVGLVTSGSRQSPQINIVAHIGQALNLPVRAHCPEGELSEELKLAQSVGCEIIQHPAGYNNVIKARAREDAIKRGWTEIPFGMECEEAIKETATQVANIPVNVKRIIVPVGSGITLAGILQGLKQFNLSIPVVGIQIGAAPEKILDKYAPKNWRDCTKIVQSGVDYHIQKNESIDNILLDPIYEAKCLPFLEAGDCFWIVGIRESKIQSIISIDNIKKNKPRWIVADSINIAEVAVGEYDLIFSCPPYYNLEIYSELPGELSNFATYDEFLEKYKKIIAASVEMLKPNRFAVFIVGDIRDDKGFYRKFPWHTIEAFEAADMRLYNEAVLVTAIGSLPIRIGKPFGSYRKLGKTHQNVLCFFKGDPQAIKNELGEIKIDEDILNGRQTD